MESNFAAEKYHDTKNDKHLKDVQTYFENAQFHPVIYSHLGAPSAASRQYLEKIGAAHVRKLDSQGIRKKIQATIFQIISVNIVKWNARMIAAGLHESVTEYNEYIRDSLQLQSQVAQVC